MQATQLAQYLLFLVVVTTLVWPAGSYMARVFEGQWTLLDPLLRPVEKTIYRLLRTSPDREMTWRQYAIAFICFSAVGTLALYVLLRIHPYTHAAMVQGGTYASCCANNGQTMAGLSANTLFYNVTTVVAMLAGRFGLAVPALALAGALARQGRRVATAGTLPSDSVLFAVVAIGSAVIIGALNFLPAVALGPALEHFLLHSQHPLY